MAGIKCRCGNILSNVDCPSPNIIQIFSSKEVNDFINKNPEMLLIDFETAFDRKYKYWYCDVCERVYEVQNIPLGRVRRSYIINNDLNKISFDIASKLQQIYVFFSTELYEYEEKNVSGTVKDFFQTHPQKHLFYISEDEKYIYAFNNLTKEQGFIYTLDYIYTE